MEIHSNKSDFIQDYNNFNEILKKKYGEPLEDKRFWKNDLYKDDYSHWGMAISLGHLALYSKWETPHTAIISMLAGENFDIKCGVEYSSKKLKNLEEKSKEKKEMEAF